MNTIKRLMAVLLVGGAGFGLFVACGGEETSCTFDADCSDGQACEGTVCVDTCATAADCAPGEICAAGVNTELLVCQADSTTTNNTTGMTNNNTTTPNNNTTVYYDLLIQSTTTAAEFCGDTTDPGPDIFAVGLEDSTGAQLGWGIVDWEAVQFDGNDQTDTSVIDGSAPDVAADNCPDMFDGNVVALGCDADSYIVVSFVDASSQPIALDGNDQFVRVYEYGGQCDTGTVGDTYNVSICTDTAGAKGGDISSCTIQVIVDGGGESDGEIGF
jgi:hypothetical protein